jgi:hypothetical protein
MASSPTITHRANLDATASSSDDGFVTLTVDPAQVSATRWPFEYDEEAQERRRLGEKERVKAKKRRKNAKAARRKNRRPP